jgi:hypothetical protein
MGAGNDVKLFGLIYNCIWYNLEYLKRRTFWLDLKMIVFTVLGKREVGSWKKEVRRRETEVGGQRSEVRG